MHHVDEVQWMWPLISTEFNYAEDNLTGDIKACVEQQQQVWYWIGMQKSIFVCPLSPLHVRGYDGSINECAFCVIDILSIIATQWKDGFTVLSRRRLARG